MKERIKKYIGEIFLLVGIFILVYNILNFDNSTECGHSGGLLPKIGECTNPVVAYYYASYTRINVALGTTLIALGALTIKHRKQIKISK